MNWNNFNTYNDSPTHAFEVMCNQIFELYCKRKYKKEILYFNVVNGEGGDGGVEAYAKLKNGQIVAVQSKWFRTAMSDSQIGQIRKSVRTAMKIRPNIKKYIVCIPRDLSSKKSVKNNGTANMTEYDRWSNLKKQLKEEFDELEIELWNETNILNELQQKDAEGVFKFWFQNSEISEKSIRNSFDKQKLGWLSPKYIGKLHTKGYINKYIEQFLGTHELNNEKLDIYTNIEKSIDNIIEKSNELLDAIKEDENEENNIKILKESLESCILLKKRLSKYIELFANGGEDEGELEFNINLYDLANMVDNYRYHDRLYFHYDDVKKAVDNYYKQYDRTFNLPRVIKGNKLIITGNPGMGKTHAVANIAEKAFDYIHTPILIRAKSIEKTDTWLSIIRKSLGLSAEWSEDEVFNALEAITFRKEKEFIRENGEENNRVIPKIIICIDGIDESKPYDIWLERIRETEIYESQYNRIKFVFLSRPYVFEDIEYDDKLFSKIKSIPFTGDVNVRNIFDGYIEEYKVNINGNQWIKNVINTPLLLRLFCEVYKGKTIDDIDKRSITINKLFMRKIEMIDKEYRNNIKTLYDQRDCIILRCLICLTELFLKKDEYEREELIRLLKNNEKFSACNEIGEMLNYLEDYGFLECYVNEGETLLYIPKTYYLIGNQPSFDFMIACKMMENYKKGEIIHLKDNKYNLGALQMFAIQILEEYNKLIFECDNIEIELSSRTIFDIVCYTLVNVSMNIAERYKGFVRDIMSKNANKLRLILKQIILPVSTVKNHPLGPELFNDYMMSFDKPAQRDLIWSLPTYLNYDNNEVWNCREEIDLVNNYHLDVRDYYNGLPIVYAWALTTVENTKRSVYRAKLTKWGLVSSNEFYSLFCKTIVTNDPQMREDLLSIAYGICMNIEVNRTFIEKISKWILENIFRSIEVDKNIDAAVRYYARGICEIAYDFGIINENEIVIARPPYNINCELLPINIDALKSSRMNGYGPIDYDLARYVLCDPIIHNFMNLNREYNIDSKGLTPDKLLKLYKDKYEIDSLLEDQFIISLAYEFIVICGWNKKQFSDTGGADRVILNRYHSATHGSMSNIMSVAEKYVWCGKYKLLAYFADRLNFNNYDDEIGLISDYCELEDFPNALQELIQENPEEEMRSEEWIAPEMLAKKIDGINNNEEGLKEWLSNAPLPDYKKWIKIREKWLTLYGFISITNSKAGICEDMWISSGLIKKDEIDNLIHILDSKKSSVCRNFVNPENFHTHHKASCYLTPIEICRLKYKRELDEDEKIEYGSNRVIIKRAISECVSNFINLEEIYYKFPSRTIRDMLGITYGDGKGYYNDNKELIALYTRKGEKWGDSQYLLRVKEDLLLRKLKEEGYQMFWIARTLREASSKLKERYKFYEYVDRTFIIWFSNDNWNYKEIEIEKETEPIERNILEDLLGFEEEDDL